MTRARNPRIDVGIDRVLDGLTTHHIVAHQGAARLCVSKVGAFTIVPARGAASLPLANQSARIAHDLAARTRADLGEHLSWVPFVDALVVCFPSDATHEADATIVPVDLLAQTVTDGPARLHRDVLDQIRELVRTHRLDGWAPGVARPGDRIDLCDPSPST